MALKLCAAVALLTASFLSAPAGLSDHAGQVDIEGTLEVQHGDDFVNKRAYYAYFLVTSEGERIALDVGGRAAEAQALAGANVRVSGSLSGRSLTVSALDGVILAEGPAAGAQLVSGEKKVLILNINFQNDTSEPWTLDQARQAVFTNPDSVNEYYQEESAGLVSLAGKVRTDGDVHGWYTIPFDNSPCDIITMLNWAAAALDAASADGVDPSGYDNTVFAWPNTAACPWGGWAFFNHSFSFINGYMNPYIVGHELGHNYWLNHASGYDCTDGGGPRVSISESCTIQEYGDPFDIMGSGVTRHKSNWQKGRLGFLAKANTVTVTPGTDTHSLAPSEQPLTGQTQALRIPRRVSPTEGVIDYYYLDFRQPFGTYFDDFLTSDPVVNGVTIRIAPDYGTFDRTLLIDATPGTASFYDAPLPVDGTFFDPATGASITTLTVSPTGATVEITVDSDSDGDGLTDTGDVFFGTDPFNPDSDADGCLDGAELHSSAARGGLRDPLYLWDVFDTDTENGLNAGTALTGTVAIGDIFAVAGHFGDTGDSGIDPLSDASGAGYHTRFDRGDIIGANDWNRAPADGAVTIGDIFAVAAQFGLDC
jgi:hypothetical protein